MVFAYEIPGAFICPGSLFFLYEIYQLWIIQYIFQTAA